LIIEDLCLLSGDSVGKREVAGVRERMYASNVLVEVRQFSKSRCFRELVSALQHDRQQGFNWEWTTREFRPESEEKYIA